MSKKFPLNIRLWPNVNPAQIVLAKSRQLYAVIYWPKVRLTIVCAIWWKSKQDVLNKAGIFSEDLTDATHSSVTQLNW